MSRLNFEDPKLLFFLGLALLFIIRSYLLFVGGYACDVSWILIAADRMLEGGELYKDAVDVNPPLIFVMNLLPVGVAKLFSISPFVTYTGFIFLVVIFSLGACYFVLKNHVVKIDLFMILLIMASVYLIPYNQDTFGQREHIMIMLVMPYLLAAGLRIQSHSFGDSLQIVIGIMAAIGFCIKPQSLFIPLLIEMGILYQSKSWRSVVIPQNIAMGLVGAFIAVMIVMVYPDYLTIWVPMARDVYSAFINPLSNYTFVICFYMIFLLIIACIVGLSYPYLDRKIFNLVMGGVIISALWFAFILIQGKFYPYHFIPFIVTSLTVVGIVSVLSKRKILILLSLLIFLSAFQAHIKSTLFHPLNDWNKKMVSVLEQQNAKSMYVFSTDMFSSFPAANLSGATWASRHVSLWYLPAFYGYKKADLTPQRRQEIEQLWENHLIEDFKKYKTDIVFVDVAKHKVFLADSDFEYIPHFTKNPRFAEIWKHYQKIDQISGFDGIVLDVYKRIP